jgi:hypothetical protein
MTALPKASKSPISSPQRRLSILSCNPEEALAVVRSVMACKYLIPSGAPDTGAAQGALPVGGHRVERLLCGFLALQSF